MIFKQFGLLILFVAVTVNAKGPIVKREILDNELALELRRKLFFVTKQSGLWQAILDQNDSDILDFERKSSMAENALALDYHIKRDLLFWSTSDGRIYSCPLSGGLASKDQVKLIYTNKDWYPVSLAVDFISDLLYVVDAKANTLHLISIDGQYGTNLLRSFNPILADEYQPRYIEIDPYEGYLFLLDNYNNFDHLYRLKLDASGFRRIDPLKFRFQKRLGAFSLDLIKKEIFVSSLRDGAILAMNYDGENLREVLKTHNCLSSMSITQSYIYGANITSYAINPELERKIDILSTSLLRCDYKDSRCPSMRQKFNSPDWGVILQIKAIEPAFYNLPLPEKNPCDLAIKNCDHICIRNPQNFNEQFSCRCKTGWRLAEDKRRCERIEDYLIYENDNFIGGIDTQALKPDMIRYADEAFMPFKIQLRHAAGDLYGFDYDPTTRNLYFTGLHNIFARLSERPDQIFSIICDPSRNYGLLAKDENTQLLYFVEVKKCNYDGHNIYSIGVATIPKFLESEGVDRRSLIKMLRFDVGKVRSLEVHSRRGYLYFVSFNAAMKMFQLARMNVDGSDFRWMDELGEVMQMTIDLATDKIYYIDASNYIYRANLNGSMAEKIISMPMEDKAPLTCLNGFAVHGDYIYLKDTTSIRRIQKSNSTSWARYDPYPFNYNMRTQLRFHSNIELDRSNPCLDNVLGCTQFCFGLPLKENERELRGRCDCADDYTLNIDGKSCSPRNKLQEN